MIHQTLSLFLGSSERVKEPGMVTETSPTPGATERVGTTGTVVVRTTHDQDEVGDQTLVSCTDFETVGVYGVSLSEDATDVS